MNVLWVWAALGFSQILLFGLGNGTGSGSGPRLAPWTPSGQVIGAVWFCLYTLMALSLWRLNRTPLDVRPGLKIPVDVLIALCLTWVAYGLNSASRWPPLVGNAAILATTIYSVVRIGRHSRVAAAMIVPVGIWITIASTAILDGARRYGW